MNDTRKIVVFITAGSFDESRKIADTLLNRRKAACVTVIPKVNSSFWWKGKIESSEESLLVVKSKESLLEQIIDTVKTVHSYEVPEIIAMPIIGGTDDYLQWIDAEVQ